MGKEYRYEGETFLLDDSEGCYIKVTYKAHEGYVGVNLKGTPEQPYCWYTSSKHVTKDGLTLGNVHGPTIIDNLNVLCSAILRNARDAEARKEFNPEEACEALHEFVEKLA